MRPSDTCFESGSYEACLAQYNSGSNPLSSWQLDVNAYADEATTNPYVVGSPVWAALHPAAAAALASTQPPATAGGTDQIRAAALPVLTAPVAASSPEWATIAVIGLIVLLAAVALK